MGHQFNDRPELKIAKRDLSQTTSFKNAFSTVTQHALPVPITQKQLFLYAGIGLALSGIATILVINQGLGGQNALNLQNSPTESNDEFRLEEVRANPNLFMHIHVLLEITRDGQKVEVPAEVGIKPDLWNDHSLDEFGPARGLVAPMHTHDASGNIHIESVVLRNYTLGEFLSIWGISQDGVRAVTTGDGTPIANYQDHVLTRNEKLMLEINNQ